MRPGTSKPMSEKLKKYKVCEAKGCWLWTGAVDRDGYGRIRGSTYGAHWFKFAHRASYEHYIGPIPLNKQVLHKCDVPRCINPNHLYLGDPARNGLDKKERGRARTTPQPGTLNGMYGRTGPLNPMFGKTHSAEVRAKISATKLLKRKIDK